MTHDELIPQLMDMEKKQFNWDNFAPGLFMFVLGLSKKVLLADTFGTVADWGFSDMQQLDSTNALLVSLAYTIQIYFDFSGYCDMAIGLGKMMNLELPINFNSPYKARTILEFWERWHMTLTRFFTQHIYIPLGGNRKGTLRTYFNVMVVFLVSGIWHGANYTFIVWGLLHGLFSVITRWKKDWFRGLPPLLGWSLTFAFVNLTWVLFRSDSLAAAGVFFQRLFSMEFGPISEEIIRVFQMDALMALVRRLPIGEFVSTYYGVIVAGIFCAVLGILTGTENAREKMLKFRPGLIQCLVSVVLLVWSVLSFSGVSIFLYFNF